MSRGLRWMGLILAVCALPAQALGEKYPELPRRIETSLLRLQEGDSPGEIDRKLLGSGWRKKNDLYSGSLRKRDLTGRLSEYQGHQQILIIAFTPNAANRLTFTSFVQLRRRGQWQGRNQGLLKVRVRGGRPEVIETSD